MQVVQQLNYVPFEELQQNLKGKMYFPFLYKKSFDKFRNCRTKSKVNQGLIKSTYYIIHIAFRPHRYVEV